MSDSVWRTIEGENPERSNSGDFPDPPIPGTPIYTSGLEDGPWGVPWLDGLENPDAAARMAPSPDPQMDVPDIGWKALPGAYEGAYRTRGPVMQWGHEVSGGWDVDQEIGRIMRFPANIPERYDANGVWVGDYRDLLAVSLERDQVPAFTDTTSVAQLLQWEPAATFGGWDG